MQFFYGQKQVGEPVTIGEWVLRPESRLLGVVLPVGGFVWQWPTAVFVTRDNETTRQPVVDVVRTAVLMIWSVAAAVGLLARWWRGGKTA